MYLVDHTCSLLAYVKSKWGHPTLNGARSPGICERRSANRSVKACVSHYVRLQMCQFKSSRQFVGLDK